MSVPWEEGREEGKTRRIPERFNPVASYVKYFEVPSSMKERKSSSPSRERRAARPSGSTENSWVTAGDSFTPSEFELTPYLKKEEQAGGPGLQMDQRKLV